MRRLLVFLLAIIGCDPDHGSADTTDAPCASPAPLVLAKQAIADEYIVELRQDADVDAFVADHHLEPRDQLPIIHGFSATLRPATVAAIRCDDRVARLTENAVVNAIPER